MPLLTVLLPILALAGAPEPTVSEPDPEAIVQITPPPEPERIAPVEPAPALAPPPPPIISISQPAATHQHHASHKRPGWGGFGYTTAGLLVGDWGGHREALTHPTLQSELAPMRAAVMFGGGGATLLGGRYILGGKGYGILGPSVDADWGSTQLTGGGGGFDVGVVVTNARRWLVYPQFGLGGQGYTLDVRNTSDSAMDFGVASAQIGPNTRTSFSSGFFMAEVGVAFQRLMYPRQVGGGLISGGEIGLMMSLTDTAWTDANGARVSSAQSLRMVAAFFRLNIGGGGFWWTKYGDRR